MATFYHSNPRTLGTIKNWGKTQYLRANIFIAYTKIGDIGAVHRDTRYTQFHSRGAKSMWKVLFYLLVCIHSPVRCGGQRSQLPPPTTWVTGLELRPSVLAAGVFTYWVSLLSGPCMKDLFEDRLSLCSPGCPGTPSVDQAGLELRDPLASVSLHHHHLAKKSS